MLLGSLFVLGLSGCGTLQDHYGAPADPTDTTEVVVSVPKGSTARGLGPALETAGVVSSADDWVMWLRLSKEGACIKAGDHRVSPSMSASEVVASLCGVPVVDEVPFTIIEGWRIKEIDEALAAKGWTEPGEYRAAVTTELGGYETPFPRPSDNLEGYLYPETYMVIEDRWSTRQFVQRQLDLFGERFYTPHQSELQTQGRSLQAIVIMASMLEREEPKPSQRPMVAGILWKRLDNSWNLGVDATSRYTLDKWNDRRAFLKLLRDPDDPYNTRLRGGLPPTAIGNPTLSSLQAALAPEGSEWWYYLHDSKGIIHPARDSAGHEANRRKYDVY